MQGKELFMNLLSTILASCVALGGSNSGQG